MALVMVFLKVDDARRFGMRGIIRLRLVLGVEAGAGALLPFLVPKGAALPDAVAHIRNGAEGGVDFYHNPLTILFIEVTIHDIQYLKSDFGLFGIKRQFIAHLISRVNQITIFPK